MGLDPDDDSYTAGDACNWCNDALFGGVTPKKVLAVVQDIVKCAGKEAILGDPPNGSFTLTQILPCRWQYVGNGFIITWTLSEFNSSFIIVEGAWTWFNSGVALPCFDVFGNQTNCVGAFVLGSGGFAKLWWGPQIGKLPCA